MLSLSIFVIFKVLTVIVHSGVPDGSNSAVLEGGKIHCLLHSRSGRSHAQGRGADVTPAERLENTRNINSSHSAQAHLFHLGIILFSCFSVLEKDKGDKTFGFSFVSLMRADGTTIPDGGHELCVYKVGYLKRL